MKPTCDLAHRSTGLVVAGSTTVSETGKGVLVGVIDTGIDITHPDLRDNIWTNPGEIAGNGIDDAAGGTDWIRRWLYEI